MNDRLVLIEIPADHIVSRAIPTGAELARGYELGFVGRAGVVAVELAKLERGFALGPAEEGLALLLSDELHRVDDLVEMLAPAEQSMDGLDRFWMFMLLAWVLDHRRDFADPLQVVEMISADFGHPHEIDELVRFMPAQPGQDASVAGVYRRWTTFVERVEAEYAARAEAMKG